jgi:transcriptional regulator with XRE-family HTH domain
MTATTYAKALGLRLRAVRTGQKLTLQGVEELSRIHGGHRWNAAVIGSYERADRAISVENLARLARFYGVPTVDLLPPAATAPAESPR